jgi:hypothetical protein
LIGVSEACGGTAPIIGFLRWVTTPTVGTQVWSDISRLGQVSQPQEMRAYIKLVKDLSKEA